MAAIHDSLVISFRKSMLRRGFQVTKSPMPTYRPDVFAERCAGNGRVVEQIIVEAEIESTLFSEHTSDQLVLMHEFIEHQGQRRIKARGYLLVPKTKRMSALANSLVEALFPEGTKIRVLQKA